MKRIVFTQDRRGQFSQTSTLRSQVTFGILGSVAAAAVFAAGYFSAPTPQVVAAMAAPTVEVKEQAPVIVKKVVYEDTADRVAKALRDDLQTHRDTIAAAKDAVEDHMRVLSVRTGELKAQLLRVEALGGRLVSTAKLDGVEFDFSSAPALGGPEESTVAKPATIKASDIVKELDGLQTQITDRERQLLVLESLLVNRSLNQESEIAGRPLRVGWLSSRYGYRNDPFNGRKTFHKGVDFAGPMGGDVVAVGGGVVTWANTRAGYGRLVEINHGNGYVTRYGHSKKILVNVGDRVEPGQVIAYIGSSGRSTGPHVHFEVWKDGTAIDPLQYIRASRK